jgi:hypothetical protein
VSMTEARIWSGGKLLVWKPEKPGDELAFKLPVEAAGKYQLRLTAAMTPDSGQMSVRVDGQPAGFGGKKGIVDLAVEFRTLSRVFSSSPVELTAGEHTLTLKYAGDPGRTVGLDFIWVQKR